MSASTLARDTLRTILDAALGAVDARAATRRALNSLDTNATVCGHELDPTARFVVVAIGKAASGMADAAASVLGDRIRSGLVVTKDGHAEGFERGGFEVMESGHPLPDERSAAAARRVLACVEQARPDDLFLLLLSGGASALVSAPPDGVGVEELARTNQLLLESGADITELNAVRKHLSEISGGRLALRAAATRIAVLAISDVAGNRLDVIGSGPCAPDPSRFEDAIAVLERRGIHDRVPASVRRHLDRGCAGEIPETPKPGDAGLRRVAHRVIASNADARRAAEDAAAKLGAHTIGLGECVRGEARKEGRRLAALALSVRCAKPVCVVAGGESVVVVRGDGHGGRNQELALAAAIGLAGTPVTLLAAGSDGSDGATEAAGAFCDGDTVARARALGLDPERALARNDAHGFFCGEGGLLRTGPTGTNVMDLVLLWLPGCSQPMKKTQK